MDFLQTSVTPASEKKFGNHPTQKPVSLMKHFVELLSNQNDVVLDPFMGSGTTGVAAVELERDFVGVEISPEYYKLAQKRIEHVQIGKEQIRLF